MHTHTHIDVESIDEQLNETGRNNNRPQYNLKNVFLDQNVFARKSTMEIDTADAQVALVASGERDCHVPHGPRCPTNPSTVISVLRDDTDGQVVGPGHGGRDRWIVSPLLDYSTRFGGSCLDEFGISDN